jgi:hypothetical protein
MKWRKKKMSDDELLLKLRVDMAWQAFELEKKRKASYIV